MTKAVLVCATALLLLAKEGFAEEWKWFCEVEYSAGVVTDGHGQWYSGKMIVPEDSKHLLVREEGNKREPFVEKMCRETLSRFVGRLNTEDNLMEEHYANRIPRQFFAHNCLASKKLIVKEIGKPDNVNNEWTYYSYGGPDYEGAGTGSWFNFYAKAPNAPFGWGVPLDAGSVVRTGNCKPISK
jgi:hypothetical protein